MTVRAARPGYTLTELVLVLALIVLLAAMAYPSLDAMYADLKVQAAADEVRAAWVTARTQAVNEGRAYRFAVIPNGDRFRVAPLAGGAGSSAGADRSVVGERTLPKGITFRMSGNVSSGGGDGDGFTNVVVFLADGTAQEDREIVLSGRDARPLVVRLRALTGVVTVQPYQPERGQP
jgi:prepilin-type N-terminal cleavage/methylation domain-containing protein